MSAEAKVIELYPDPPPAAADLPISGTWSGPEYETAETAIVGYETPQGPACLACIETGGMADETIGQAIYNRDPSLPCTFCSEELVGGCP